MASFPCVPGPVTPRCGCLAIRPCSAPAHLCQQLIEGHGDLCPGEWLADHQHSLRVSCAEARLSRLGRIRNNDNRKLSVGRVVAKAVEERLAHVEGGAVEHKGISAVLNNQLMDGGGISRSKDLVATVAERKGQELGNLGRVVDEQD